MVSAPQEQPPQQKTGLQVSRKVLQLCCLGLNTSEPPLEGAWMPSSWMTHSKMRPLEASVYEQVVVADVVEAVVEELAVHGECCGAATSAGCFAASEAVEVDPVGTLVPERTERSADVAFCPQEISPQRAAVAVVEEDLVRSLLTTSEALGHHVASWVAALNVGLEVVLSTLTLASLLLLLLAPLVVHSLA